MEFPELAHDQLLHELDLPRQQHAADVLAQAHKKQQQLDELTPSSSTASLDEHSLLLPTTAAAIALADALLSDEEQQAVHADDRLSAWEIVRVEWRLLARLSTPMVRFVCPKAVGGSTVHGAEPFLIHVCVCVCMAHTS